MAVTIDNNHLQNMNFLGNMGSNIMRAGAICGDACFAMGLQNLQVNSVIDNAPLQNLNILGSITGDPYFEGYLQQLGSGPVTIDNNGLQNLIPLGPVFADAGKAAGHSIIDSISGSFLQNMQVNSVIDNDPLQDLILKKVGKAALGKALGGRLQNMQFGGATDAEVGFLQNLQFGEIAGAVGVGIGTKLAADGIEHGLGWKLQNL